MKKEKKEKKSLNFKMPKVKKGKRENIQQNGPRKPISRETIYKMMFWITLIATCVFFVKNIFDKSILGMTVIGICLIGFLISTTWMKKKNVDNVKRELVLSIMLVLLVLIISLSSGKSYSDDFPLFLAVLGITGLYLEPKLTMVQLIMENIALIIMYIVNPEKGGDLPQYILCQASFILAGALFWRVIKRGRAFINVSDQQAEDAKDLLRSIRDMGDILQADFEASSVRIDESTKGLKNGSGSITKGTEDVAGDCNVVQDTIQVSAKQIFELNEQVKKFENAMADNQKNIDQLRNQLNLVTDMIAQSNTVFDDMKERMDEVTTITNRLSDISVKTTVLSLNAAVEAANVGGSAGVGFEVVASEMKELAENSDQFVVKVSEVMEQLMKEVDRTAQQFVDSTRELKQSGVAMNELQNGFNNLKNQFGQLYDNIEEQNKNVNQVDNVFKELRGKVTEMRSFSMQNQAAVEDIVEAMGTYKLNIGRVINNTRDVKISSVLTHED